MPNLHVGMYNTIYVVLPTYRYLLVTKLHHDMGRFKVQAIELGEIEHDNHVDVY